MDEIKEIFESLNARIKNPFFGYTFFFIIFLNWKVWFFIIFANVTVETRFTYFDVNTTPNSLIFYPLGLAILSSIFSPWLRLFFVWVAKYPTIQRNILQTQAQNRILEEKNKLEKIRSTAQAIKEEKIISQAQRDAKVKAIEDDEERQSVQQQLEELRNTVKNSVSVTDKSYQQNHIANVNVALRKSDKNNYRFYIRNGTSSMIKDVNFSLSINENEQNPFTTDYHALFPISKLHVGDEVSVKAIMTLDSPSKFEYTMNWLDSNDTPYKKTGILTLQG